MTPPVGSDTGAEAGRAGTQTDIPSDSDTWTSPATRNDASSTGPGVVTPGSHSGFGPSHLHDKCCYALNTLCCRAAASVGKSLAAERALALPSPSTVVNTDPPGVPRMSAYGAAPLLAQNPKPWTSQ